MSRMSDDESTLTSEFSIRVVNLKIKNRSHYLLNILSVNRFETRKIFLWHCIPFYSSSLCFYEYFLLQKMKTRHYIRPLDIQPVHVELTESSVSWRLSALFQVAWMMSLSMYGFTRVVKLNIVLSTRLHQFTINTKRIFNLTRPQHRFK